MKIRYQNGTVVEGITLTGTGLTKRIAVQGRDDTMELTNIHGTWVSDDCEPVTLEIGMAFQPVETYSDEYFICPQELASQLVSLLLSDSAEDLLDEASLAISCSAHAPILIA